MPWLKKHEHDRKIEHFNLTKRTGAPTTLQCSNSNNIHDEISPWSSSPEAWPCQQQPLTSNRSFASDTSQGPVTINKAGCPCSSPPAWLLQLQSNLKPGNFPSSSTFFITSLYFMCDRMRFFLSTEDGR